MSFLTPLYLAGLAAIALPIIFHLIRRTPEGRVPFSTLMFLAPSLPRMAKRKRLEDWPLLLLRALVLGLVAFAFARPYLRQPAAAAPPAEPQESHLVLVDTSASMRRADLWNQAQAAVREHLGEARPTDRVSVLAFDQSTRPLFSGDQWQALSPSQRAATVQAQLAAVQPTWAGTNLGAALVLAAERLVEEQPAGGQTKAVKKIVLVSDLQQGAKLDDLQDFEWPEDVSVEVRRVAPADPTNAAPVWAGDASRPLDGKLRVRVVNSADAAREQFTLAWEETTGKTASEESTSAYVPPGESRVIRLAAADGSRQRLLLSGDVHEFDNVIYRVPAEREELAVVYLGDTQTETQRQTFHYLQQALGETAQRQIQLTALAPSIEPTSRPENLRLIVVGDQLPEVWRQWTLDFAASGGTVLVVMDSAEMGETAAALLGAPNLACQEAPQRDYAILSRIDFSDPLFAPFAEPQYSDFTKIRFWRRRELSGDALNSLRTLATFDTGEPALVAARRERGNVFALTSGWHPDDSQLAMSSKFVPLVNLLVDYGRPSLANTGALFVGDAVPLPEHGAGELSITKPDGAVVRVPAGQAAFTAADLPGIYQTEIAGKPWRFAVNLPPAESRTAPLDLDDLAQAGVRLASDAPPVDAAVEAREQAQALAAELEARHKIWRYLAVAGLGILISETWLAGWSARRRAES
ncbi:MAG: BatA domain-containing protein [Pirellulales bacterium]